jgi:hypothetical protein
MNIDLKAHYQAIFDAIDGAVAVPVLHVYSGDSQVGDPTELPFIVYRQEVERLVAGTRAGGDSKVMTSNWVITAYSHELGEALDLVSVAFNALVDTKPTTTDGYTTTAIEPVGVVSLWEKDAKNYAVHGRIMWERSL